MQLLGAYKLEGLCFVLGTHWPLFPHPWNHLRPVLLQRLVMSQHPRAHLALLQVILGALVHHVAAEGSAGDNMHVGVACDHVVMDEEGDEGGTCMEHPR